MKNEGLYKFVNDAFSSVLLICVDGVVLNFLDHSGNVSQTFYNFNDGELVSLYLIEKL